MLPLMATHQVHVAIPVVLTPEERTTLERWARGRRVSRRLVRRARIVLQAAAGLSVAASARALHTDRECVGRWRARFLASRLAGLQHEALRPGRPPVIPDTLLQALVILLTTEVPPGGRPWSVRSLARLTGVSPATIHRLCQATGLTPHWARALRLRIPPPGFSRLTEVLGGYLTPLDSALVVGGDVVGPEHPAPCPTPRRPGDPPSPVPARYALPVPPPARVIVGSPAQNRVPDYLRFLDHVAARVPREFWVHIVADNLVTHLHPAVPAWFADHPEVVLHLLPADDALPRWFLPILQQWVGARLPPAPPLPPILRKQPKWLLQDLQARGRLRLPPNPRAEIRTLRAAVEVFRPRSIREQNLTYWMVSKQIVKYTCGNPKWHLPLDPRGWGS
ncbi:MAG TPA: helix-turn-helix domain-containing protein [Candidatus Methylomirabilis sp.]|nr:helix-turn-helix domain-containing protein [Candidatus Methylomirabilis sp.]